MPPIDFKSIAAELLARADEILPQWFPNGRRVGAEFVVGDIYGNPGDSLSINTVTGLWADFATGAKGGDLISLYAARHGLKQAEAAKMLREQGFGTPAPMRKKPKPATLGPAPEDANPPRFHHHKWGKATAVYTYRRADGKIIGYISRHDPDDPSLRKQFLPWSWDTGRRAWRNLAFAAPRPLYGLDLLAQRPDAPVMIVEGEKAADAARKIVGDTYVVVTWPGGAKALDKIDFTPLHGRKLLLWPDADEPGRQAMATLGGRLLGVCDEIKIINPDGQPDGWDAADALEEGWTWPKLLQWAKPRAMLLEFPEDDPGEQEQETEQHTRHDPDPMESKIDQWLTMGLDLTSTGAPIANLNNAMRVLEKHPALREIIWYDDFHEKIFVNWKDEPGPREWCDADDIKLCLFMQREIGIARMNVTTVHDAVTLAARTRRKNEVVEWMESLKWDGQYRLADLMPRGFGAEDNIYSRAVGECWITSMVARAYRPGCKVDYMPVFESEQGKYKSTALSVIGGQWFAECHESILSKDFYGVLQGKLLVEIAELSSFRRAEVERVKGVITCQVDRYRSPYGRNTEDHPRKCVFAGTTNRYDWNMDETGARRFWPIRCTKIDIDWIRANRDQLFAEAVARFKAGKPWWDVPQEDARREQEARRQADSWEDAIREYLVGVMYSTTTSEVMERALGISPDRQDRNSQSRVSSIMRLMGWKNSVVYIKETGKNRRVWVKSEE